MSDLTDAISILNRLLDSGISFKKAYYGVFGDVPDSNMCELILSYHNCGDKLTRSLKKNI